ncbi:MAG: Helix-turn-helix domain [Pseudomonadota bacterium]|jgi:transposase
MASKIFLDKKTLQTLYVDQKLSLNKMSEILFVSSFAIRSRLLACGIPLRAPGPLKSPNSLSAKLSSSDQQKLKYELINLYEQGLSLKKIAAIYNTHVARISSYFCFFGIPIRQKGKHPSIPDLALKIKVLRNKGMSIHEIAAELGTSYIVIYKGMRKHKISTAHKCKSILDKEYIQLLLKKKHSKYKIATKLGVSFGTIDRFIKRNNLISDK